MISFHTGKGKTIHLFTYLPKTWFISQDIYKVRRNFFAFTFRFVFRPPSHMVFHFHSLFVSRNCNNFSDFYGLCQSCLPKHGCD